MKLSEFARELREHPPNLKYAVGKLVDSDSDDLIVAKMLHEVRVYCMHHISEERKRLDLEIEGNIESSKGGSHREMRLVWKLASDWSRADSF